MIFGCSKVSNLHERDKISPLHYTSTRAILAYLSAYGGDDNLKKTFVSPTGVIVRVT